MSGFDPDARERQADPLHDQELRAARAAGSHEAAGCP